MNSFQYADSIPLVPDEGVIAHIIDITTGEHVDDAYNLESALNYVQDGAHVAVAAQDEVHACRPYRDEPCYYCAQYGPILHTRAELQAAFDHERRLQEDCFSLVAVA